MHGASSRPRRRGISPARFLRPRSFHPAQLVVLGFGSAVAVGALLLSLPVARTGPGSASLLDAVFTSTSAVCVTGLIVVSLELRRQVRRPGRWSLHPNDTLIASGLTEDTERFSELT